MTIEEKRQAIRDYCKTKPFCFTGVPCPLYHVAKRSCFDYELSDVEINTHFELISSAPDYSGSTAEDSNPYWTGITKIAKKQREKGINTYGRGLELNNADVLTRLTHIEEELIDGLMYLEWLKEKLNEVN